MEAGVQAAPAAVAEVAPAAEAPTRVERVITGVLVAAGVALGVLFFSGQVGHAAAANVTMPTGGASQYDISPATNDIGATVENNGADVAGIFAAGSAMVITTHLVRRTRRAV